MSDQPPKRKALGRGLSALLESPETDISSKEIAGNYVVGAVAEIPVAQIESSPFQPRTYFNEQELSDLAQSILQQGIIQPITIRKIGLDKYQLIAGERRLKAARLAGLTHIPAYIRVANDEQLLEMALVENIQRQDLNPLEIAVSFQRLIDECNIRQEDLSVKVGKDRSTISNYIRLLRLPSEIQVAVRDNLISMGHARALINIEDISTQLQLLQRILEKKLSVRQVEDLVRKLFTATRSTKAPKFPTLLPSKYEHARNVLNDKFQSRIDLKVNRKGIGSITIPFSSEEEFDRIMSKLES
jgi:ParB family chromosome partitioning protein